MYLGKYLSFRKFKYDPKQGNFLLLKPLYYISFEPEMF